MFLSRCRAQCTPSAGLRDGSILWDDLQQMTYANFRHRHSSLNIPCVGDTDPLFALWSALNR